ncbi:MAG: DEAD/DEAH box helicase [Bacteroidota bacterium]
MKITRQFLNAIEDLGFEDPLPIQEKAIPMVFSGHDVIGIAQTGTGKTLAYGIPIVQHVKYAKIDQARGLILVPTRELVLQVEEQLVKFAKYTDLRILPLMGGKSKQDQIVRIKEGVDIIVSTPGRLMELYLMGEIVLKRIEILVLDEADRMMDMGFMPQLRDLLEVIPTKRQNLLFSATFSDRIEELSYEFLEFPKRIEIAPQASTVSTIIQNAFHIPNFKTKLFWLEKCLNDSSEEFKRVIIFCRTKKRADSVANYIGRKVDENVRVIHSNKGQSSRLNAFKSFKNGELRFLVTTDVSSRGIDIDEVSHVINFDIPVKIEDYTHRIGRTGRVYKVGQAISFVDEAESFTFKRIQKLIGQDISLDPIDSEFPRAEYLPGERKEIGIAVDREKRIINPNYQGAFHEKKRKR